MKILVTGANGFIAKNLFPLLTAAGYEPSALLHKHRHSIPSYVATLTMDDLADQEFDAIINLAGANIAASRWTPERKKELYDSRVLFTQTLYERLKTPPSTLVSASAVGYYGFDNIKAFSEDSVPNPGFTHDLCDAWERAALRFTEQNTRVVIFRLGVVLGHGGALDKMKWPFKLGIGGKIGTGKQNFPWVHVHDVCRFILSALKDTSYTDAYNLVAPQSITQAEFAKIYAASLSRPARLTTPRWALELIFGEMSSLLTKGQRVMPKALQEKGFEFEFPTLQAALKDLA